MGRPSASVELQVSLSENVPICNNPSTHSFSPLPRRPEPVSEINVAQSPLSEGCATLPRMGHLLGYARVSTTDQHSHL